MHTIALLSLLWQPASAAELAPHRSHPPAFEVWRALQDDSLPGGPVAAAVARADPLDDVLLAHNTWKRKTELVSSSILLGWSVANIGVGAGGWALAKTTRWQSFHQMSIAWNAINLSLAIPGLVGALRSDPARPDMIQTIRGGQQSMVIYALNTGLDVGWMATGAWLWDRGLRIGGTNGERLVGFGQSMVMQGGYLFVFDIVNWLLHGKKQKQLLLLPEVGARFGMRMSATF